MILIIITGLIFVVGNFLDYIVTETNDVLRLIIIFIVFISWYLIEVFKTQDENHEKILALIKDRKTHIPFADQIEDSQFEFKKMVYEATRSILVAGPNLNFVANNQEIKDIMFKKLKNDKNFKIKMLLSDPECGEICDLMSKFSPTNTFKIELNEAITKFCDWMQEVKKLPKENQNLLIKKTDLITISLLFIDANLEDGRLLVIPITWGIPGESRPCFLISKKQHYHAFYKYYHAYSGIIDGDALAKPLKCTLKNIDNRGEL